MRNNEMEIGKIYRVQGHGIGTKAELLDKGIKRSYSNRSDGVKVKMLNGRYKNSERALASRDVQALWTDEDEQRTISQDERAKRSEEMYLKLSKAGFEPSGCQVRLHDQVFISFGPGTAERVYDKLINDNNKEVKN